MPSLRLPAEDSLQHALFSDFQKIGVDDANGVLHGVIVASKGEAKGHGLYLGDAALDELAKLKSVPFRVDPPPDNIHGGAMAIEGEAVNFRRDGDDVRADVKLFDLPGGARARVLKLADTAAHLVGMSLDLLYKVIGIISDKLKEIVPVRVRSLDLVDRPASARALFSQPSTPSVDIPPTVNMNYTFLRAQCAKFGIQFPAEDKDVTAELESQAQTDLVSKLDSQATKLKELEGRFCPECGTPSDGRCAPCTSIADRVGKTVYFTKKDDGTFEQVKLAALKTLIDGPKKEEAPKPPAVAVVPAAAPSDARLTEKDLDAIVAKLQSKGFASIGGKPAKADDSPDGPVKITIKPEITNLARVVHAAKLATISAGDHARFIEEKATDLAVRLSQLSPEEQTVCIELQLDPAAYSATKEKCSAMRN